MKISVFVLLLTAFSIGPSILFAQELPDSVKVNDSLSATERFLKAAIDSLKNTVDSLKRVSSLKDSPYKISIGATFNFLEGLKANDLYAELSIFVPHLFGSTDPKSSWRSIGLYTGFYQGRSFTGGDSLRFNSRETTLTTSKFIKIEKEIIEKSEKEIANLGLYFSLTLKAREHLYLTLYSEVRKRDIIKDTKERIVKSDTTIGDVFPQEDTLRTGSVNIIAPEFIRTNYRYYFGFSPLLNYSDDDNNITLQLNPVLGYNLTSPGKNAPFFLFQLKLTERRSGIRLGAELRTLLGNHAEKPEILIYLVKEFPITILTKLFGTENKD